MVAPSELEIHLLGPFRIHVDSKAVDERHFARRKPKLLIKLLALQPHHQLHREQVIEMLWPDAAPDSGNNNLHKTIHMARHALEPSLKTAADSHFIITQSQQVLLRAPQKLWIDVDAFEEQAARAFKSNDPGVFETALDLYDGPLLIEDLYEDWATSRREQLRELHQGLLGELARIFESKGDYQASIERLKQVLDDDETNEEVHRRLMRLYALTGNRHQAIRQYQQCAEAIRREMEAEPDSITTNLHREIESGRLQPLAAVADAGHPTRDQSTIESIAILPLANLSRDATMEYLSDGIAENIINRLAQLPGLRVMAWGTVVNYKGKEFTPHELGRDLGVRAVMMGRVLEVGERLAVKIELIDVADGSQLWGGEYNRARSEIFAVQEDIALEISEKLRLKLTGAEKQRLSERHTENIEAYHAYLKGRYYWNKRSTDWLKRGVEQFQQAISLDPGYASAYAGLSDSYTLLVVREAISPQEGFAKAKAAASMALRIDDTFGAAHASLGHAMLHNWEWQPAAAELRRAIRINPGYPSARHWYSEFLTATGQCEESINELRLAGELDPLSLIISADLGRALYYGRLYDQVIEQENRTLEMDADFWLSYINRGRSYMQKGMFVEAMSDLLKACELSAGNTEAQSFLAFTYAATGQKDKAREILRELDERSVNGYVPPFHLAIVHAGLGETDLAFECLERAFNKHAVDLFTLKVEPMLDGLRADARFSDLVRRVGLEQS